MRSIFICTCLSLILGCGKPNEAGSPPSINLPSLGKELSQNPSVSIIKVEKRNETGITVERSGKVFAKSRPIIGVLRYLCPDRHYLKNEVDLPAGVYDISITPSPSSNAYHMLRAEVQRIFSVAVSLQDVEVNVSSLVVISTNCPPDGMQVSKDQRGLHSHNGKRFQNYEMQRFCGVIDSLIEEPVLNKTELNGQFDFDFDLVGIQFTPSRLEGELSKCGLDLKKEKAMIRQMTIRKKDT